MNPTHATKWVLSLALTLSGCDRMKEWVKGGERPGNGPLTAKPDLSPTVAASLAKNLQTSGIPDESGAPYNFGPCVVSLRAGNVTCDFGIVVYDSAATPKIFVKHPETLRLTDDKNMVVSDGLAPERFLVGSDRGKVFRAIAPQSGIREVQANQDGTFTAFLEGQGKDVYKLFDANKHLIKEIDAGSRVETTYTYNGDGLLTGITSPTRRVSVTYNEQKMPAKVEVDGVSVELTFEADAVKAVRGTEPYFTLTKPAGADLFGTIEYGGKHQEITYTGTGVSGLADSDGSAVTIVKEGDGKVVVKHQTSGNTLYMVEFDKGRRVQSSSPTGGERVTRDAYGRITMTDALDGRKTSFAYDQDGRITAVINGDGTDIKQVISRATYNEFGQLLTLTNGQDRRAFTYDDDGRLLTENHETPGESYTLFVEQHDNLGRPLKVREEASKKDTRAINVAYNARGEIISRQEQNVLGTVSSTIDGTTGTLTTETHQTSGESSVYKKSVNPVDQTATETRRVTDANGRVTEQTAQSGPNWTRRIEANETGVLLDRTLDPKGQVLKYSSRYSALPAFAWIAEAMVTKPAQAMPPGQGPVASQPQTPAPTDLKMTPESKGTLAH